MFLHRLRLASSGFLHLQKGPSHCAAVGTSLPQASGVRPLHGVLIEWRWQRKGRKDLFLPTLVWPGASWEDSWNSGCKHSFPRDSDLHCLKRGSV